MTTEERKALEEGYTIEFVGLAIRAHQIHEDFNFEVYNEVARQMARVKALEESDEAED